MGSVLIRHEIIAAIPAFDRIETDNILYKIVKACLLVELIQQPVNRRQAFLL
ncbi:hypothetical protein D3C78_669930 [compost metagenome]